jgi:nucleoside-diphosphate-sugar epimerase
MNILIIGVSGFIGHHLYHALAQEGYSLIGCSRQTVANIHWQPFSFNQTKEQWQEQLYGIDLVINAVGIYQQSKALVSKHEGFSQVHTLGPKCLFDACIQLQIKIIQISAMGAQQKNPVSEFLRSKRQADQYLLTQSSNSIVLYPGIVLGEQGKSTQQLCTLAYLCPIPLAFNNDNSLPLISINQLSNKIKDLIQHWPANNRAISLIAKPETIKSLLTNLRAWQGYNSTYIIKVPDTLITMIFSIFPHFSIGIFNKESLAMLYNYSHHISPTIHPISTQSASDSLCKEPATEHFKLKIKLEWINYLNFFTLGFIWFMSGLSSLVNFTQSQALVALIGMNTQWGDPLIIIAALADCSLGFMLWLSLYWIKLRPWVLYTQIGLMLIYSLIISILIPILWLHPFAPIVKNLAILILSFYLLAHQKGVRYV